jgi:hypothetical protein
MARFWNKVTKRGLRVAWWVALTIGVGVGVVLKWDTIWTGTMTELSRGLAILFVLLVLLPIISEFEGFGFKLRTQLDELKRDLRAEFQVQFQNFDQRLSAQARAGAHAQNIVNMNITPERIASIVEQQKKAAPEAAGAVQKVISALTETERDAALIRYVAEREIWRIWRARMAEPEFTPPRSTEDAVADLAVEGMLPEDLAKAALLLLAFGGPNPPPETPVVPRNRQLDFVRDIGWTIIARLRNIT